VELFDGERSGARRRLAGRSEHGSLELDLLPVEGKAERQPLERRESVILKLALFERSGVAGGNVLEMRNGCLVSHALSIRRIVYGS